MALSSDEQSNVRELLRLAGGGDKAAEEELFRIVYTELRRIARYAMQGERPDHTLQPAALVHEAFVRLVGEQIPWNNRAHFFAVAATTMRRVLIDYARSLGAQKRQAGNGSRSMAHSGADGVGRCPDAFGRQTSGRLPRGGVAIFHGTEPGGNGRHIGREHQNRAARLKFSRAWLHAELASVSA